MGQVKLVVCVHKVKQCKFGFVTVKKIHFSTFVRPPGHNKVFYIGTHFVNMEHHKEMVLQDARKVRK